MPVGTGGLAQGSAKVAWGPRQSISAAEEADWPNGGLGLLLLRLLPVDAVGAALGWWPGGSEALHAGGVHLAGLGLSVWQTAEGAVGEGAGWHWGGDTAEASALEIHT